jgi:hypothetical protein
MSETISFWKTQHKCAYKKKDKNCLEELVSLLYYTGYNIINPNYKNSNEDERFTLSNENSNYQEYKNVYLNNISLETADPYSDSVSAYLSKTSYAIKAHFLTKDISIE